MFNTYIHSTANLSKLIVPQKIYLTPKPAQMAALKQLNEIVSGLEVDFNDNGTIRHLTMTSSNGLTQLSKERSCLLGRKDPITLVKAFLSNSLFESLFGKHSQSLSFHRINAFPFGHRVDFRQTAKLIGFDQPLVVRGGSLSVAIDKTGEIFNITSTIRSGLTINHRCKIISTLAAIKRARMSFAQATKASHCQLMLSSHTGKFNPVYEVTLFGKYSDNSVIYLIEAETGVVLNEESIVLKSSRSYLDRKFLPSISSDHSRVTVTAAKQLGQLPYDATNRSERIWLKAKSVPASALLQTPEVNRSISAQVSDTIIRDLPNPKVLRNKHFVLLMGQRGLPVLAKSDGSFCYLPADPEFAAVSTFISLNSQIAVYLELGLKTPDKLLRVFVDDKSVLDNAYFDPHNYELHIGVGTGTKRNGLNKHMSFDLGISSHEFGHNVVYLQTPGQDLRGLEGSAIHEAIGDVLGTIVMHYLVKLWYAEQFGQKFSVVDIKADSRIIGSYAAPPLGIRCQKNQMVMPDDFVGEPHIDGLIVGGALADVLVLMATKSNTVLENQIKLFAKITLMALALVPAHKVSFTDLLRALLTAERQTSKGIYRESILQCFSRHGITPSRTYISSSNIQSLAA